MSPEILRAKEIKEAISNKAGVTEAEVWVFDRQKDYENGEEELALAVPNEDKLP